MSWGNRLLLLLTVFALSYASSQRDIVSRIARWWLKLLEFDFIVKHRQGKYMKHIDALSRNPFDPPTETDSASLDVFHIETDIDEDWVKFLQKNDPDIIEIKSSINDPQNSEYIVENDKLYRKFNNNLLFVVPKGIRGRIVGKFHDDQGHIGLERTLAKIRELYWWPRMRQFVKKYVISCVQCLYHRGNRESNKIILHPIEKTPIPCHTWHLDHLGPFVKSAKNNEHILAIVDGFTKYLILKPVRNTSSRFVIKWFNHVSEYFGMPKRIITDRGSCFTSKSFAAFCKANNIQHILNATATPRANGQVERYNRTVLHSIKTLTDSDQTKWEDALPKIQWTLNSIPHTTTKVSPHELLYGFQLRPIHSDPLTLELKLN